MKKSASDNNRAFFEEFLKRLSNQKCDYKKELHNKYIFQNIIKHPKGFLEKYLGEFGIKIFDFFSSVDLDHPDLSNCYDGLFDKNSNFSQFLEEFLNTCNLIETYNFDMVSKCLKISACDYIKQNYEQISKIDISENNKCNVRLLKDKQKISDIRKYKKMQIIDLQGIYKKGMSYYSNHPHDFYKYLRFDESLVNELQKMEQKAQRYEQIGCSLLANEIRKNLANFQEHAKNTYFGFNRITMSSASIILAKNLEFEMKSENLNCEFSSENYKIHIDQNYVKDVNFLSNSRIEYFEYEPVIYPMHIFDGMLTANVKNVLNILDNFPEANDKPIFDFFGIIVPSVKIPIHDLSYAFMDMSGIERRHQIYEDVKLDFDKHMISNNVFNPIIVAEKDHKCYFISCWL